MCSSAQWLQLLLLAMVTSVELLEWYELPPAIRTISLLDELMRFKGNTSSSNGFKVMTQQGEDLLIGARNGMRRISLVDFTENLFLEWRATKDDEKMCILKGKSNEECQNFIKVLERRDDDSIILCGSNAFTPMCRLYIEKNDSSYHLNSSWSGRGLCPYDPHQSSTTIYTDGFLYAGTMADFSGTDPVIQKHPQPLRTERYDLKQLNDPSFVSSVEYGDYVYLFFRETAVEYINCGKVRYSRVGRVCKHDLGGTHSYNMRWTTFLKARLNCSNAGAFPFYFNEIQSTSSIVTSSDGIDVVYAILSTPMSAVPSSAVCVFSMQNIVASFDGPFKEQANMNANWLPVYSGDVPEPRPGACVQNSRNLTDLSLNFVKSHSLMDKAVASHGHHPLVTTTSTRYRFTRLVVDAGVVSADGSLYDMLFIGTDDGRVLKVLQVNHSIKILEDIRILPAGVSVNAMDILTFPDGTRQLVVLSEEQIVVMPLQRCTRQVATCSSCVGLRDPYCAWNPSTERCEEIMQLLSNDTEVVQNVTSGFSRRCPMDDFPTDPSAPSTSSSSCDCPSHDEPKWKESKKSKGESFLPDVLTFNYIQDEVPKDKSDYSGASPQAKENIREEPQHKKSTDGTRVYSQKVLLITLCGGCAGTLVLGFVFGWICASRCKRRSKRPYLEQPRPLTNKNTYETKVINQTSEPNNKPSNLKANIVEKNSNHNVSTIEPNSPGKVNKTYV